MNPFRAQGRPCVAAPAPFGGGAECDERLRNPENIQEYPRPRSTGPRTETVPKQNDRPQEAVIQKYNNIITWKTVAFIDPTSGSLFCLSGSQLPPFSMSTEQISHSNISKTIAPASLQAFGMTIQSSRYSQSATSGINPHLPRSACQVLPGWRVEARARPTTTACLAIRRARQVEHAALGQRERHRLTLFQSVSAQMQHLSGFGCHGSAPRNLVTRWGQAPDSR